MRVGGNVVVGSLGVLAGYWSIRACCVAQTARVAAATRATVRGDRRAQAVEGSRLERVGCRSDLLPADIRESMTKVVAQPTLTAHASGRRIPGGAVRVVGRSPGSNGGGDLATAGRAVRRRSATSETAGTTWSDGQGSDLTWQTVVHAGDSRVWFAEGQAKPGPMLPVMPIKAVAIAVHLPSSTTSGQTIVRHEVDLYLQTLERNRFAYHSIKIITKIFSSSYLG